MNKPLELLKYFMLRTAVAALAFFYSGYCSTLKIVEDNRSRFPQRLSSGENAIYVFWHSRVFIITPVFRNLGIGVLTLLDWKNAIFDRLCSFYGYQTVPVTSPAKATGHLKNLLERNFSVGLAIDGPRGPAGIIKPGFFYLSKITRRPIIAITVNAKRSFRMKRRWDRLEVPFPFTEITISMSEPFYITADDQIEKINIRLSGLLKDA